MLRNSSAVASLAVLAAFAISAAPGCGPRRYAYAPATTTGAEIVGHPAAEYVLPPDTPHGDVRLATFGLTRLAPDAPRAIHIRMVLANRGPEPWLVDTLEQKVELRVGDADRRVLIATGSPPARLEVRPGKTGQVDLFFPLPGEAREASKLPEFDAIWTVHVDGRTVTTRTPFERFVASGPAQNAPSPRYPFTQDPAPRRLPGTPDVRWPQPEPAPDPQRSPGPPPPM